MADAAAVGARVLAGLERGRQRAIAQRKAAAAPRERAVRRELDLDVLAGHPERGRAARIARVLRLDRRAVARVLARLQSGALSSASRNPRHDAATFNATEPQ
jgi:hypothetical protein